MRSSQLLLFRQEKNFNMVSEMCCLVLSYSEKGTEYNSYFFK